MIPYYTQLPNRNELIHELNKFPEIVGTDNNTLIGLMLINIRRFRNINIEYNSSIGDGLLNSFNKCIHEIILDSDRLFHMGNDEFAILFSKLPNQQVAENAVKRIIERLSDLHIIKGKQISVRINIGVALNSENNSVISELMTHADIALSHAREKNEKFVFFNNQVNIENISRTGLITDLKRALKDNQLTMAYQPQYNFINNKVIGAEALARWHHSKIGNVPPDVFVYLAEQSGLIEDLTYWSINTAIRQWSMIQNKIAKTTISVNLSASALNYPDIFEWVEQALNMWGLDPQSLIIELTESSMMKDPENSLKVLNRFSENGIRISIDDFGTGYSSLNYLKQLPVSELKIDKSFVLNMTKDKDDDSIVQSVIHLAHNFNMSVVAEGIENKNTYDALSNYGCDIAQGYYISRPIPIEDICQSIVDIQACNKT